MAAKGLEKVSELAPVHVRLASSGALIALKDSGDWCHICGKRREIMVECSYPANAELTASTTPPIPDAEGGHYVRVCDTCVKIFHVIVQVVKDYQGR